LGTRRQELKLNIGVGYLHIKNKTIQFINNVDKNLNKTFYSEATPKTKQYDTLQHPRKFFNSVCTNKLRE